MFIIINGGNLLHITTDANQIPQLLASTYTVYEASYARQAGNQNSYMVRNYGSPLAYASAHLIGLRVMEVPDTFSISSVYDIGRKTDTVSKDITSLYVDIEEKEVITGYHVTARVVKKGLKSTGKSVVVVNHVGGEEITTPAQLKALYDKMVRINVRLDGWGAMTMSPDSLDEYARTPKTRITRVVKLLAKAE